MNWPGSHDKTNVETSVLLRLQILLKSYHQVCDSVSRPLDQVATLLTSKNGASKRQSSWICFLRPRETIDLNTCQACKSDILMAQNNPPSYHRQDQDQVDASAQDQDIAMLDATGCNPPMKAKNKTANQTKGSAQPGSPGPGPTVRAACSRWCPSGGRNWSDVQPPDTHTNMNEMQGEVTPNVIERLECKHLLERLGFSLDTAQVIIHIHGYHTLKKLSLLKSEDVDILVKTLHLPGREHKTMRQGIMRFCMSPMVQHVLTSECFTMYHCVQCNMHPMINLINNENVHDLSSRWTNRRNIVITTLKRIAPRGIWQTPNNLSRSFKLLCRSNGAQCSYMIHKDIVSMWCINKVDACYGGPDAQMIKRCPIIPIDQHHQYYDDIDAEGLKDLDDLSSLKYVLDSVM